MTDSPTDWNEVKNFYLACRSYKQTAEHFNVSFSAVKMRAYREKWTVNVASEATSGLQAVTSKATQGLQNVACEATERLQNATCEATTELQNVAFPLPLLPCLSNFQAQAVRMLSPWETAVRPRDSFADKNAFKSYLTDSGTDDCLFCGVLGLEPLRRVSRENKPSRLLAIVADYDTSLNDAARAKKLGKLAIPPNFISVSFSGGTHAVWFLERALPLMPDASFNNTLLRSIAKDLKLSNAFGALDVHAFHNLSQYYTSGRAWQKVTDEPIPAGRCEMWVMDALKSFKGNGTARIPLERVKAEVDKRFPGRWSGEFSIGARGVRFWDATADNPTAAIVTENGMVCFTGAFPFRSWTDIFGADFVQEYAAETMGRAIADIYYINHDFWRKNAYGAWFSYPRRELNDILQNEYGLNSRCEDGETISEVSRAISAIVTRKVLQGRIPFIYNAHDVVEVDGRKFLNTSIRRALKPGNPATEWGEGFPWIADFLIRLFGREDTPEQLDFFLSWLAHAYQGALKFFPTRGQAIYIAGRSGSGKSFLSKHIIAPLFGGREEATSFLMGETRFNNALFDSGIWNIDDAEVIAEPRAHARYSALVKKVVANDDFLCEAKYINAVKVPWKGRLVVTCNTDPESLRILPAIDINNSDKLMFFLCTDSVLDDPEAEARVRSELAAFAGFLSVYELPENCRGTHRFGVKSFLHPMLMMEASNSGTSGTFQDVFCLFLRNYFTATEKDELRGSASEIYEQMCGIDTMRELMKGLVTPSSIGTRLGQLAAKADFPMQHARNGNHRYWLVRRDQFEAYILKNSTPQSDELDNCPF